MHFYAVVIELPPSTTIALPALFWLGHRLLDAPYQNFLTFDI